MYIEDELPRLVYGDAVCKIGNKYATNFIIFRLQDRKNTEGVSEALVKEIADKCEVLRDGAAAVETLDFYGHDFGMDRLGYLLLPFILRRENRDAQKQTAEIGKRAVPAAPGQWIRLVHRGRNDGREGEQRRNQRAGCNVAGDDDGSRNALPSHIYYYWIAR